VTPPKTFTYTWTQARLETIQDQFRFFLTYGAVAEAVIDKLVAAVGEKTIEAVGLYAYRTTGGKQKRVVEVELRVDWAHSAKLTLTMPTITGGLSGWDGKQAPEVKIAGRRFVEAANEMKLEKNYWVLFVAEVRNDKTLHERWTQKLNVTGTLPDWERPPIEGGDALLDLGEASIYIRRAGK
jgi:hypothetical protein